MELKEDKNRIRLVVGWIVDIAVVISIAWFAVFAMGTQIRVSGQSMEPVLSQNEKVLMNRLSYRVMRPKRYDIIVFEKETGNYNIKRVIGLPVFARIPPTAAIVSSFSSAIGCGSLNSS